MAAFDDAESVLRQLGLQRDAVQGQADFYVAYARELEKARRSAGRDVWNSLAKPDPDWMGPATIASTYRLAAQFLALIDPAEAVVVAIQAAMAYLDAGMPFGALLAFGLMDDTILRRRIGRRRITSRVIGMLRQAPTYDPVQQTYLLLATAARPWLRDEYRQPVLTLRRELDAHQLHPIGAQGSPLATYLRLASAMLEAETPMALDLHESVDANPESFDLAVDAITSIGRRQAADLRAAQQNTYLWQHAAAPLDVVDLEDVALFGVVMRSGMRPDESSYDLITERMGEVDPLVQVPLWAADQLYRDGQDRVDLIRDLLVSGEYDEHRGDGY